MRFIGFVLCQVGGEKQNLTTGNTEKPQRKS
jgi:hypothetical protein